MLRSLGRRFLQNPLIGKELATGLTSPRLGAVFTFVGVVYLATDLLCYLTFYLFYNPRFGPVEFRAGTFLHGWHGIVAYGVLCLLLPLRLAGHIEGPRAGRAFDQVVVTGVSPVRMCLGNWMLGLGYAALLLLVTLPFEVMAYVFGGVTKGQILACCGVLLVYSNVIIAVTLGLAVVTSEWLVVPLTVVVFGIAGIVSFVPDVPPVIAEISPVRFVVRQFFLESGFVSAGGAELLRAAPRFFFLEVPAVLYTPLLWGCLTLPFAMLITLGPSHFFLPGFNVFGSVVLPGDSKRARFRRLRHGLVRRIEMAFYYENRPAWCDRWDFPLRTLVGLLVVVLLWGAIFGVAFAAPSSLQSREAFSVSFVLASVILFFWVLAVGQTRLWTLFREKVGRLELSRGTILNLSFLALFAALLLIESVSFDLLEEARSAGTIAPGRDGAFERYRDERAALVGVCSALFFNIYLLSRVLAWVFLNAHTWRVWVFLATNVLLWAPIVIYEMARRNVLHIFPPSFARLVYLSPYAIADPVDGQGLRGRFESCIVAHAWLTVALAVIGGALWWWLREGARWPSMPSRQTRREGAPGVSALLIVGLSLLCGAASAQPAPVRVMRATDVTPEDSELLVSSDGLSVEGDLPVDVVEAVRGFDGRAFSPAVDFLTVVLENRGAETLTGRLRVGNEWHREPWRAFELPTSTKVPLRFTLNAVNYWWSISQVLFLELESERGRLLVSGIAPPITVTQTAPPARVEEGGRFLIVSETPGRPTDWQRGTTGGAVVHILCRPLALPEDWASYAETSAVLLGSPDLSRWTSRQRRALYDYVRLGGSVILFGRVDVQSLRSTEPWGDWFERAELRNVEGPGGRFALIEFPDGGETPLYLEPQGGAPVPLLGVRSVGAGRLGHLGFDPTAPKLPPAVASSTAFWAEFTRRLPKSLHPVAFAPSERRRDQHLNDPGSLYLIIGYFALYTLLLGPGLFLWFRQKARRPYMWGYALTLCGVFAAGVYALDWVVHTQPSRGEIREMILFGRDSTTGVSYATVRLRSCGRQRHALRAEGNDISSLSVYHDHRWRTFAPRGWLELPGRDGSARELSVNLAPWSGHAFALLGETSFRTGVSGKAIYDTSTQQLRYAIESEIEPLDRRFMIVTYNLNGQGALRSHIVGSTTPGTFRGMVAPSGGNGIVSNNATSGGVGAVAASTQVVGRHWSSTLAVSGGAGPRVMVAWSSPALQPGLRLSSEDVLFRQDGTLDANGRPYREYREFRLIEDEGEPYHLLHQQLIVQEIALEVR